MSPANQDVSEDPVGAPAADLANIVASLGEVVSMIQQSISHPAGTAGTPQRPGATPPAGGMEEHSQATTRCSQNTQQAMEEITAQLSARMGRG